MDKLLHVVPLFHACFAEKKRENIFPSAIVFFLPKKGISRKKLEEKVSKGLNIAISSSEFKEVLYMCYTRKWIHIDKNYITLLAKGRDQQGQIQMFYKRRRKEISEFLKNVQKDMNFLIPKEKLQERMEEFFFPEETDIHQMTHRIYSTKTSPDDEVNAHILTYIQDSKKTNLERYKMFEKLAQIAYLYMALRCHEISVFHIEKEAPLDIYVDTNIVFSLLGFHDEVLNAPVQKLFEVLKAHKEYNLKIFDFTLDEIKRVLAGYHHAYDGYKTHIPVASIYHQFKKQKIDPYRMQKDILPHLEERLLSDFGIKIISLGVDLLEKNIPLTKIQRLREIKGKISDEERDAVEDISSRHDLFAISTIKKFRDNRKKYSLEESKALFLTADGALSFFNFHEHHHAHLNSFPEVVHYATFSPLIWAHHFIESTELPLLNILAGVRHGFFIDVNVWETLCSQMQRMLQEGRYTEKELSQVLQNEVLQQNIRLVHPSEITLSFFKEMKEYEEKNSEKTKSSHYKKLLSTSEKGATLCIQMISLGLLFAVSYLCYRAMSFLDKWWTYLEADFAVITFWIFALSFILHFGFGITWHPIHFRKKMHQFFSHYLYRVFKSFFPPESKDTTELDIASKWS